jgi:subtilase family serine protease
VWAAAIQTVRNDTTSVVSALKPVGRLEASRHLRLAISLPLRNQAALIELLRQLQDPSSPNYHKYLTPAQFTERFGPAETDYEAVAAFAKAHGLTVTARHPNRMILDVDGAVSDIEKTLHVTMRTYQHPREPRQFYAPDADPTIAGLPVSILHVSGLDDYSIPHPNLHLKPAGLAGKATPSSGSGPGGTYAGGDFRAAYVPGTSMSGSGQSVALLEFDAYYASDISSYQAQYGPPTLPPLANVPVDGGVSTPGGGDAEVSLDIEMAMSMAPKLSAIYVYEEPNGDPWVDILNQIADDDFAKQVSCSWAGGSGDPAAEPIFIQMAMQGQSFFQASGDSDAYTGPIPFPSDSSNITVVGATELSTTGPLGSFVSETVWNWGYDAGAGEYVGSSGGVSTTYTIPSWQQPVSMSANQGSTTMRDIPDVAMVGDNIEVYYGAGLQGNFGGTSCAAPLWAAFTALVNQQAVGNLRNTVGFINPAVYAIGTGAGYTSDFNDTSTGNNFSSSSPTKFSAVAGYDLCTGWGSPAGTPLINALAGPLAPIISTGSPLPNGVVGTAYSTALAASGGLAPYTWSISAGNLPAGLTLSPNGGVISGTPGASGASSFTVQVTGSNGAASTTPFNLTIYPQGTPIIATASPLASGTVGVAYSQTFVATGGATPYTWSIVSGSPPPGLIFSSVGLLSGTPTATGSSAFTVAVTGNGGLSSTTPFYMTVNPPEPVITSALSVTGTVGVPLSYHITASNSPTSYGASGLPAGLSVNSATGVISGTASATGISNVTINATNAGGTGSATLAIVIVPDQVSYFTISSISSSQVLNAPIAVTITAYDINNIVITAYAGTLSLTATNSTGAVPISPTSVSGFVNGVWTGTVAVQAIATNVVLTASDGAGHSGSSDAFNVAPGPLNHFGWSAISSPQQALEPFAVTITAQDAGNNTVASYSGSASLTCSSAGIPIGVTPAVTGAFSAGVWSGNVTLLQTGTAALLRATDGIANFYVADSFNSTIRKVTAAGVVTTVAGTPLVAGTTDGTGSGALFGQPYGVAVDGAGVIYVADSANNTIRKITAGGVVTTLAGSPGLTGTNDGTGSAARFNDPYGLAVDGNGNLYIADTLNYTVRKMTPGGAVTTIGGRAGVSGTQAGVGSAASFSYCVGIVVSPAGTVYVVDSGNDRISEGVSVGGQYTWSNFVGMPGSSGSVDGTGSGALFDDPEGIALDGSGNQYVTSSTGDTVRRVSPAGVVMTLAGVDKSAGSSNGTGTGARFYAPYGVGMDLSGNAWVVDSGNSTIREVTPAGAVTTVAGSPGNYGYANGTGSAAQFHFPNGGATDNGGHAGYSNSFNISQPASISVSPAGGLSASGTAGGPFTPESTIYTISNTGNAPVNWTVSGTSGWLSYSTTGGTIASGFSVPLSVTVNSVANTLASGNYGDTITFANTTNGVGNTTRPAALTVFPSIPVITSTLNVTGTSGVALSYSITATNSPATYNATGLPAGLSVNMMTGLISGTVAASGTFDAVISASNLVGTGSATLAITMRTTFSAWQDLWFTPGQLANPAISGDMATPAGDGIPNLLKYALNLNPLADGAGGLPVGSLIAIGGTDYLTLTYRQVILATDITYIPEVSGDLQTWNSGLGYVATVSVTPNADGVTETVVVQDMTPATPGTSQYIRLRVTAP